MKEQIAIIGMGCVYPDAPDIYGYWNKILEGKKSIHSTSTVLLDSSECDFVTDEIESNEIWKAFSLIATRQALVDANCYVRDNIKCVDKERIGAIISVGQDQEIYNSSKSSILNSILNKFDIRGFSCALEASSPNNLACIKIAIEELKNGNSSVMLAGAISNDGVGVIVLKRLIDAKRDGDRIYSIIRSIGVVSEGNSNNIYQLSKDNKISVINKAYDRADVSCNEIGLIETSGIGKELVDASEFCALTDVFRRNMTRNIVVGSIKNENACLNENASMAGIIKISLALYQKVLPPSIYEENMTDVLYDTVLGTLDRAKPWLINNNKPTRYAAISAFEQGGVNYHIVLEEVDTEISKECRINSLPRGIMFNAFSKDELISKIGDLAKALNNNSNAWKEKKYNYYVSRNSNYRLAFVASNAKEVSEKCYDAIKLLSEIQEESWIIDNIIYDSKELDYAKACVVFGGDGIDDLDILSEILKNYSKAREIIKQADNARIQNRMEPISQLIYPLTITEEETQYAKDKLKKIANIQPIMATMQACIYDVLKERGLKSNYIIGHSFSELVALWADDVFDLETLIDLASTRGFYVSNVLGNTAMLKIFSNIDMIKNYIYKYDNLYVSNINSPFQIVVAGNANEIEILKEELTIAGIENERLSQAGAYHTPYMVQAAEAFGTYLNNKKIGMPNGKVLSSYSGNFYGSDVINTLVEQIINPVLYKNSIEKAYEEGARVFIEIGCKNAMNNLIKETLGDREYEVISFYFDENLNSVEEFELQLARLAVCGYSIKADKYASSNSSKEIVRRMEFDGTQKKSDDELNEIITKNQVVIKNNLKNIDTLHTEVFSKFMDSQNYQINAISRMIEVNKDRSEEEKKQVIDCIGKFRDNSLSAFKIYFGDKEDLEDKQNIVWSEEVSDNTDQDSSNVIAIEDKTSYM